MRKIGSPSTVLQLVRNLHRDSQTHDIIGKRKVDKVQHPRATAITFEFGRHNDTYTKVPQHPKSNRSTVEGDPIFLKKPYFFNFTENGFGIFGC